MRPDTLGKHGHGIGEEKGKGHGGAYKLRISYHMHGMDMGDRDGQSRSGAGRMTGDAPRTTGRWTGGQRDGDSQPASQTTATSESTIGAQTPTPPVSTPPFS